MTYNKDYVFLLIVPCYEKKNNHNVNEIVQKLCFNTKILSGILLDSYDVVVSMNIIVSTYDELEYPG